MKLTQGQSYSIAQLGHQFLRHGQTAQARAIFEGLITVQGDWWYGWYALGSLLEKEGEIDLSVQYLDYACRLAPQRAELRVRLAEVCWRDGRQKEALAALEPLSKLQGKDGRRARALHRAWTHR